MHEFSGLWQAAQAYPVSEWWRRAAAVSRLKRLADTYGGEFLAGLYLDDCPDFEDWRLLQSEQYHQQMLVALSALADHALALADPLAAMPYARRQLALEAWREVAHRQLMMAHLMMGQPQLVRQQYDTCCRILATELGIHPGEETQALWAQLGKGDTRSSFTPPPIHNRPATPTPFIGRQQTLGRVLPLLLDPDYRLLTLTGVGGVGKTRLALEAGAKMTAYFGDGVWFVPLVGVTEQPDDADWMVETIATAVAQVLSVTLTGQGTAQAQLLAALKGREMLLILDNFEHLQAGVSLVTALMAQCPAVKLLVTSRNRLNLQSEVHVPLTGLPVGEVAQPAAAVELFQERAGRVDFSFALSASEQPLAIQLCQFLEGVPLSIELAAGWIDRQPLAEIVATIAQDLDGLATTMADVPERHRSLRAVFTGSWRLLTEIEQQILARLAIFRGGFQPEAVAGVDTTVLSNLVEHFLLRQGENGRYDLHELLRQFSFEKLTESGFLTEVQEGHSRYYLQFVAQREIQIRQAWLTVQDEMVVELGNIRQAWAWAITVMDVDLLTVALPGIYALYRSSNLFREGEQVLGRAAKQVEAWLQQAVDLDIDLRQRAETLLNEHRIMIADFLNKLGRGKDVPAMMETAVAQAVQLENVRQHAAAEVQWGIGLIGKGAFREAQTHLTQAHSLAETIQDENLLADCLVHLGLVVWYQGDYSLAREYCQG
ncbi:MAG: hypothetical protein KDE56_25515, partial [Anaerolineales bacterium]|nr:hypothetical protein [Anaerolineales bacterium]